MSQWDLFDEFDIFQKKMEKMFSSLRGASYDYVSNIESCDITPRSDGYVLDISENNGKVEVIMELPGLNKEDVNLEAGARTMRVTADTETKKVDRTIALPCEIDADSVKAEYNNGILEVVASVKRKENGMRKVALA